MESRKAWVMRSIEDFLASDCVVWFELGLLTFLADFGLSLFLAIEPKAGGRIEKNGVRSLVEAFVILGVIQLHVGVPETGVTTVVNDEWAFLLPSC